MRVKKTRAFNNFKAKEIDATVSKCFETGGKSTMRMQQYKISAFGANERSNYQQVLHEVDVARMDGKEQGGDVCLELLVVHANLSRRFIAQNQLYLPALEAHCTDEVHVHEWIGDALDRRLQISGKRSFQEPLRDIGLIVQWKHLLLPGEKRHLGGFTSAVGRTKMWLQLQVKARSRMRPLWFSLSLTNTTLSHSLSIESWKL